MSSSNNRTEATLRALKGTRSITFIFFVLLCGMLGYGATRSGQTQEIKMLFCAQVTCLSFFMQVMCAKETADSTRFHILKEMLEKSNEPASSTTPTPNEPPAVG